MPLVFKNRAEQLEFVLRKLVVYIKEHMQTEEAKEYLEGVESAPSLALIGKASEIKRQFGDKIKGDRESFYEELLKGMPGAILEHVYADLESTDESRKKMDLFVNIIFDLLD
jgi:hemerythrin